MKYAILGLQAEATSDTIAPVKRQTKQIISLLCSALLLVSPVSAVAEPGADVVVPALPSAVIITEIQTGAAAAGDEFVEIFNVSDSAVDITGWQIRYANAGTETTTLLATVAGPDAQPVLLPAGGYYTFHVTSVPIAGAGQVYSASLAKTDKTVALFAADPTTCQMAVADAVAWALPIALATKGEGTPLDSTAANTKEKLLQRQQDASGAYIDTNNNSFDFVMTAAVAGVAVPAVASLATPGAGNQPVLPVGTVLPATGASSTFAPVAISGCVVEPPDTPDETEPPVTPPEGSPPSVTEPPAGSDGPDSDADPQPSIPAANLGLKSPFLSEFLPNPAKPQTDKEDEFIELYNPNNQAFDLSGYSLEVGLKTIRRYTIPSGTKINPQSFRAFFSADTKLALSNSGSVVALVDPFGKVLVLSQAYASAKDGQAWVLANGKWQWTTKPTPNGLNVVSAPAAKTSAKVKTARSSRSAGAASGSDSSDSSATTQNLETFGTASTTPLHPGVLALITLSALLYGAYEYRHDVANRLYQFRTNRAARREARKSTAGR